MSMAVGVAGHSLVGNPVIGQEAVHVLVDELPVARVGLLLDQVTAGFMQPGLRVGS